ncbi:MAG: hypothetical protein NZ926_01545 [Candidatus Methanomethylicia archaeon]|nr:hypothetical protein [Candidatus Methanomethylicia archaeon]MCX8169109.1 hypothetical protein [Candidatus Methanomethylicia archaeon]MDW7988841.1 hypothetical protein [Nitrososphaerota archaeon]
MSHGSSYVGPNFIENRYCNIIIITTNNIKPNKEIKFENFLSAVIFDPYNVNNIPDEDRKIDMEITINSVIV